MPASFACCMHARTASMHGRAAAADRRRLAMVQRAGSKSAPAPGVTAHPAPEGEPYGGFGGFASWRPCGLSFVRQQDVVCL